MTRNERRLIALAQKYHRLMKRKQQAAREHKSTEGIHAQHVEVTRQLIAAEIRAEKQSA